MGKGLWGMGTGTAEKPQGYPQQSLVTVINYNITVTNHVNSYRTGTTLTVMSLMPNKSSESFLEVCDTLKVSPPSERPALRLIQVPSRLASGKYRKNLEGLEGLFNK